MINTVSHWFNMCMMLEDDTWAPSWQNATISKHPDFSNAEDETISAISLFQPAGYASWEYMWLPKPRGAFGVSNNQ